MYGTGCYYKLSLDAFNYGMFNGNSFQIEKQGKGYSINLLG